MENIKQIQYSDCNVMVYLKTNISGKFEALSSLKTFTIAPNLMYACLIPYDKLDNLKELLNQYEEPCKKFNYSLQIRSSKDRKKILHQIN